MKSTDTAPAAVEAAPAPDHKLQLDAWPFYWITRVTNLYLERLEVELKRIGLDVPRWRVLMSLHAKDSSSVSEIAELAIVKLPTMTKIVQRMVGDGLVTCRTSAADGRVTEVLLTETGHEARRRAWAIARQVYAQAFEGVTAAEIRRLNAVLSRVFENLY